MSEYPHASENNEQDCFWINKFLQGHEIAFEQIFNKYKALVFNLAYRAVRHKESAEDIAQEVFLKIYHGGYSFDPKKAKFATWLYRITVNASFDFLRKRRRVVERSLDEDIENGQGGHHAILDHVSDPNVPSPREVLDASERILLLQKEMEKLPRKLRIPLVLYQFKEMSYRDIAEIIKISPKAVERRLYHAKEQLKARLSKHARL